MPTRIRAGAGRTWSDAIRAGGVAAILSGIPSTAHALMTGADPLEATLAAGSIVLPREERRAVLVAVAVPLHVGLSLGWALVLARVLPRRGTALWGSAAGLGIALLDLGWGRRRPRVAALRTAPQLADHIAYGAIVGMMLARRSGADA